jgi:hypothetical protein
MENRILSKKAMDITPKDDAFHGSKKHFAAEWWYFDAVFDNNYSTHIGFKTFSIRDHGLVSPMIEIYKNGKLIEEVKDFNLFCNFQTSKNKPMLKILHKPVIVFDEERYKKTGEWVYNITMKIKEYEANLEFKRIGKGWKIETEYERWAVALPKAKVRGYLKIKDKKIDVKGWGYHDHNWNFSLLTAMNFGRAWYWGRVKSKKFNIVWANILKTKDFYDKIAVLNKDKNQYFSIKPENIVFETSEIIKNHGKKIPTVFHLKIDEKTDNTTIKADVKMKIKELQYDTVIIAPYWRYHVTSEGYISVNGEKDIVDEIQIMEFMRFG